MSGRSRSTTLNIELRGNARGATTAMNQVDQRARRLQGTVAGLASRMGGLFAVGFGVRVGIREAEAWNSTLAQTNAVIASTGNAANLAAADQIKMVKALEAKVAVDREIINQGANVLRTFTKISDAETFEKALEAGLNMSTALDMELQPAVNMIGKALQDPVKGLNAMTRAGVSFTEQQKDQVRQLVESGQTLEAQKLILDELEVQYGGAAAANADASERARIATENLAGSVTRILLPGLTVLSNVLSGVATKFEGLPAPMQTTLVVGGLLALAAPKIAAGYRAAAGASDAFRLGLMGVTQQKAGAANAAGRLLTTIRTYPAAAGAAAAGLAVLSWALVQTWQDSKRAAEAAADLRREAEATGASLEETFRDKLAKTLAGVDGGFDLGSSGDTFSASLERMGVSAEDLLQILGASKSEFKEFTNELRSRNSEGQLVADDLDVLRGASEEATRQQKDLADRQHELGVETDDASDSIDGQVGALGRQKSALERATEAVERHRDKVVGLLEAERSVERASASRVDAVEELADAERAALGDSDEYRDAREAIADAHRAEQDAARGVVDAQKRVTEAQVDLNRERQEAVVRLRDLAQASRDAALAEQEAVLAAKEARNEAARKAADPRATALERERAALEVAKADAAVQQASNDRTDAEARNAAAQKAGVDGDEQVVQARQRVAEANEGVVEAEQRVRDAQRTTAEAGRRAAKVLEDAKASVAEAAKRVEDAILEEAEAWGELGEKQGGAKRGVELYRIAIAELSKDLSPDGELRKRLEELGVALSPLSLAFGNTSGQPVTSIPSPDALVAQGFDGRQPGGGRSINITNVNQGTPTQQRRANEHSTRSALDEFFRRGR